MMKLFLEKMRIKMKFLINQSTNNIITITPIVPTRISKTKIHRSYYTPIESFWLIISRFIFFLVFFNNKFASLEIYNFAAYSIYLIDSGFMGFLHGTLVNPSAVFVNVIRFRALAGT